MVELAAGVQHGHHDLGRAHSALVHVHGDAATIVPDAATAVRAQNDEDVLAVARQVLVDRVVDAFPYQVMQRRAVVDVPDVHAGTFAHGLETFEHRDVFGTVACRGCCCRLLEIRRQGFKFLALLLLNEPHGGPPGAPRPPRRNPLVRPSGGGSGKGIASLGLRHRSIDRWGASKAPRSIVRRARIGKSTSPRNSSILRGFFRALRAPSALAKKAAQEPSSTPARSRKSRRSEAAASGV
jgi:hypothetical protein